MRAVLNEDEMVADMLQNAAKLYRTMIKGEELLTLEQELEFCDAYLSLFEGRFEDRLFYDISCPTELKGMFIEKFSIQPIIENYLHHGLNPEREDNFIEVSCHEKDKTVVIQISNNGKCIPSEDLDAIVVALEQNFEETEGGVPTGLFGVDYRIKQRYGKNYGVRIENSKSGVTVTLIIPIRR